MQLSNQALVTVAVAGRNLGVFDTQSGGGKSGDVTKHRPGGSLDEVAIGGLPSRDDLTVTRVYDLARDQANTAFLESQVDIGVVIAAIQDVDRNMLPVGQPRVRTGILSGVTFPDNDSTSADKGYLTLTLALNSR